MKKKMPPRITISIQVEDAETLQGLIDGAIGTSESEDFNKFGKRVLKQLDKKMCAYYKVKSLSK